jgi:hypothetical protein
VEETTYLKQLQFNPHFSSNTPVRKEENPVQVDEIGGKQGGEGRLR